MVSIFHTDSTKTGRKGAKDFLQKIWSVQKKAVLLHKINRETWNE